MKICDFCGKQIDVQCNEPFSINRSFGYESKYDGWELHIEICPHCADELADIIKEKLHKTTNAFYDRVSG